MASKYDGKAVAAAGRRSQEERLGMTPMSDDTVSCATPKALALLESMRQEARETKTCKRSLPAVVSKLSKASTMRVAPGLSGGSSTQRLEQAPPTVREARMAKEMEANVPVEFRAAAPAKQFLSKAERRRAKKQKKCS